MIAPGNAARLVVATLLALAAPAVAQPTYGPPDTRRGAPEERRECPPRQTGDEIVVCAELEEQSQFRVEPTETDGTRGDPRAPNMDPDFNHSGVGVVFKGCFIPPCPPPMPLIIDLTAIPEAPEGSDADRAGRGLAPARGVAEGVARPDEEAAATLPG